jgi:hypothetical protein
MIETELVGLAMACGPVVGGCRPAALGLPKMNSIFFDLNKVFKPIELIWINMSSLDPKNSK